MGEFVETRAAARRRFTAPDETGKSCNGCATHFADTLISTRACGAIRLHKGADDPVPVSISRDANNGAPGGARGLRGPL